MTGGVGAFGRAAYNCRSTAVADLEISHDDVIAPTIITTKPSRPQQLSYLFRVLVAFTVCSRTRIIHIWIGDETAEYHYFYILVINIACIYVRTFIVQNIIVIALKSVIIFLLYYYKLRIYEAEFELILKYPIATGISSNGFKFYDNCVSLIDPRPGPYYCGLIPKRV